MKKYIDFEEGQKELVIPETVTVDRKEYTITDVNSECYTELGIEAVTIPKSFKTVSDSTFRNCQYLIKSVTISDGITEIDDHTLSGFLFLESVEIPESVTRIGKSAFNNCNNLKSIKLPSGITRIEDSTFSFCGFTELTIPEGVTEIGVDAFSYTKIESLKFPSSLRQHRTKHVR